jgi:ubiquinone/menaquinone biosynthesis C-methylase UbiE
MTIGLERNSAFDSRMWDYRSKEYDRLGWVNAPGPLDKMVEMANLKGHETVIDIGTGSQAILHTLEPAIKTGKLIGFDISAAMLGKNRPNSNVLLVADANTQPFPNDFADLMTARMVLHHLSNPLVPIKEAYRVLKPGGKLIVGEYVATDPEVYSFERKVFDIKEPGRHLWTGDQLVELVANAWSSNKIDLGYGLINQYSVRDWMEKSGLPTKTQKAVLDEYINAPKGIIKKMNINYTEDSDALVDRPFAFVVAIK